MQTPLKPLSASPIWESLENVYRRLGPRSWSERRVPFQITNNAKLSHSYICLLRTRKKPMTVLEIGGGFGRLAYLMCQEWYQQEGSYEGFSYILTDISEENFRFWQEHPKMKPLLENGTLKIQRFNPLKDPWERPIDVVIANYVFDSLPQELFFIEQGQIFQGEALIEMTQELAVLQETYQKGAKISEQTLWGAQEAQGAFLFPKAAIQIMQSLQSSLSPDGWFLVGDRAICHKEHLKGWLPKIGQHGTFSYPVNFFALQGFVEERQGEAIFQENTQISFSVGIFSFAPLSTKLQEVFRAQSFGPSFIFEENFEKWIEELEKNHWDPALFFSGFFRVQREFSEQSFELQRRCLLGIQEVLRKSFFLTAQEVYMEEELSFFLERQQGFLSKLKNKKYKEAEINMLFEHADRDASVTSKHVEKFLKELKANGQIDPSLFEKAMHMLKERAHKK